MDSYQFSFASFLSLVIPLVVIPAAIGVGIIWLTTRSATSDPRPAPHGVRPWVGWLTGGRLGLWTTGLAGVVWGFLACAGWLSWTASDKGGGFTGPGLPAPTSFPTWQVVACGITVVAGAVLVSVCSRRLVPGALAAALGVATGFSTAFAVGVATEVTSQEGIGVGLSMMGLTIGLGMVTWCVAGVRDWQIRRHPRDRRA
ncbi:hypothetical protein [Corynebacterium marinum]|uniref:Uncharacterized protein n=1 Tax=Corynebacterium marinum DSM 44953 TaxID=1224162 RepID=A0A0B6TTJ8_9CORY|nr:hypothetical protein [Corynebacterium marinum]AJK69589.1 hypothetical protein B840_10020 [Corynebacterium marinum DSM 44953]GGO22523.1 hypothetical protein GCM10010980_24710 [Corynebacterium marinum]